MSTDQQQQQKKQSMREYAANFTVLVYLIASTHRAALVVFLRRGFGSRFFEPQGVIAFLTLGFLGTAFKVFWGYFWLWFFVLLAHRIDGLRRYWKGERQHTRYMGYPFAGMFMPGVKNKDGGYRAEPFICLFVGLVLFTIDVKLGAFVMAGFVSFAACLAIEVYQERLRIQAMHDAESEMQYYTQRFRDGV